MVVMLVVWSIGAMAYELAREVSRNGLAVFRRTRRTLFKRVKDFNPFFTRRVPRHVPQDVQFTLTDRLGRA